MLLVVCLNTSFNISIYVMYSNIQLAQIELDGYLIKYNNNAIIVDDYLEKKYNILEIYKDVFYVEDTTKLSNEDFEKVKHANIVILNISDIEV